MLRKRNTRWKSPIGALLPLCLLSLACGGREGTRTETNSDQIPQQSPAQNCKAEEALASGLSYISDFEGQVASGWGSSKDESPKPASAPGPIYTSCPADSSFDCCRYDGDARWTVPPDQLDSDGSCLPDADDCKRVAAEKKLNKKYHCAPESGPFISAFGGSLPTQELDAPLPCKKYQSSPKPPRGMHLRAARLTDWGAQVYYNFKSKVDDKEVQWIDVSEYDGVTFWIRLGQGGSGAQPVGRSVFVAFDDVFTKENQPKYKLQTDPETGEYSMQTRPNGDLEPIFALDEKGQRIPEMTTSSPSLQATNCYDVGVDSLKCDRFGAGVGLESEWRFVKLPFSALRQRGFGVKSPAGRMLREQLMGLSFYVDLGHWDLWIDQVAFYKEPKNSEAASK